MKSENIEKFKTERDELLIKHLGILNIYDLLRLKDCFEYEFEHDIENRESLDNILVNLNMILQQKQQQMIDKEEV